MSLRHYLRRPEEVSAERARELLDQGALIVDVRRPREFSRSHVPGAVNVPLEELPARAVELPQDRVLITFCVGGLLSRGAANLLCEWRFDAVSLARGLIGWRSAGGTLVQNECSDPGNDPPRTSSA